FSSAIVVLSGTNALFFDHIDTNPTPRFFVEDKFLHTNREFLLTDTAGDQIHFYDFTGAPTNPQWGKFTGMTDANANTTVLASLTPDGKPAEIIRRTPSGQNPAVVESYLYSYVPSGVNKGLFANITLRRMGTAGTWNTVRQVAYTYYDTG